MVYTLHHILVEVEMIGSLCTPERKHKFWGSALLSHDPITADHKPCRSVANMGGNDSSISITFPSYYGKKAAWRLSQLILDLTSWKRNTCGGFKKRMFA